MLMWGLTGPIFGAIADKYGGHKAIISLHLYFIFREFIFYMQDQILEFFFKLILAF